MLVLVGSTNPVKRAAVREAFGNFFDDLQVKGLSVSSGVSDQPVGEETFTGARNRALELRRMDRDSGAQATYYVGIEGGIMRLQERWLALGCMCILDRSGREALGTSPQFELPARVVQELLVGRELGEVIDAMSGERDSKCKGGAIGYFTRGVMDRKALYVSGLVAALVPFLNAEAYLEGESDEH